MKKPLIVGFDPGTTAALAIIDTEGQLLFLTSKKEMSKKEILKNITARGKPIIVCADRNPLPHNVEKLASSFGCKVFYPITSLSGSEKIKLIEDFSDKIKNDHERDALASALKAYKHYISLFYKARMELEKKELTKIYSDVLEKLITKEAENIEDAIELSIEKPKEVKTEFPKIIIKDAPRDVKLIEEELKRKERDVDILKKYNENLRERVDYYEKELKRDDEKSNSGDRLRTDLKNKDDIIKLLHEYRKMEKKRLIPVIEIKNIRADLIESLDRTIDLTDRVIYAKETENARILNDYNIRALITSQENIPQNINFPVIDAKDISIQEVNDYKAVDEKHLEESIAKRKKIGIVKWLETYKKRKI